MIWIKISSLWILVIVLYKLVEFIVLSIIKRKFFEGETYYFYDKTGRGLSVLFYNTPAILLIHHTTSSFNWEYILEQYTVVLTGLTIISSLVKIMHSASL
jgi:hypothetical protein